MSVSFVSCGEAEPSYCAKLSEREKALLQSGQTYGRS